MFTNNFKNNPDENRQNLHLSLTEEQLNKVLELANEIHAEADSKKSDYENTLLSLLGHMGEISYKSATEVAHGICEGVREVILTADAVEELGEQEAVKSRLHNILDGIPDEERTVILESLIGQLEEFGGSIDADSLDAVSEESEKLYERAAQMLVGALKPAFESAEKSAKADEWAVDAERFAGCDFYSFSLAMYILQDRGELDPDGAPPEVIGTLGALTVYNATHQEEETEESIRVGALREKKILIAAASILSVALLALLLANQPVIGFFSAMVNAGVVAAEGSGAYVFGQAVFSLIFAIILGAISGVITGICSLSKEYVDILVSLSDCNHSLKQVSHRMALDENRMEYNTDLIENSDEQLDSILNALSDDYDDWEENPVTED